MINNNYASNIAIIHSDPQVACVVNDGKYTKKNSVIEVRVAYENYLPLDITIVERNGLRCVVPSRIGPFGVGFVTRVEYRLLEETADGIDKFMAQIGSSSCEEMRVFKEAYTRQRTTNWHRGAVVVLDYIVTLETLKENNGVIYYKNRDIIISSLDIASTPAHPYSEDGVDKSGLEAGSGFGIGRDMIAFKIELVDNARNIGNRFIFFAGEVHSVVAKIDERRSCGVYITKTSNDITNPTKYTAHQEHLSVEDAQLRLGLYRTPQEALEGGDSILTRKEALARSEHELTLLKQDLQQAKLQADQDALVAQRELAELIHGNKIKEAALAEKSSKLDRDRKEFEYEQERRRSEMRDMYERRSSERKDSSDMLKFLPMLILSIGAVMAAFSKANTTK